VDGTAAVAAFGDAVGPEGEQALHIRSVAKPQQKRKRVMVFLGGVDAGETKSIGSPALR